MHPTNNLHWYIYAAEGYHPAGVNQNPYLDMEDKTYDDEIYTDVTTGIRWYKDNIKLSASLFYLEHDGHIFEASEQLDPSKAQELRFFAAPNPPGITKEEIEERSNSFKSTMSPLEIREDSIKTFLSSKISSPLE